MWLKWRLAGCVQPFLVGHLLLSLMSIPSVVGGKSVGVCTAVVCLGVFARGSALVRVLL